jgi:hypothetical protein
MKRLAEVEVHLQDLVRDWMRQELDSLRVPLSDTDDAATELVSRISATYEMAPPDWWHELALDVVSAAEQAIRRDEQAADTLPTVER